MYMAPKDGLLGDTAGYRITWPDQVLAWEGSMSLCGIRTLQQRAICRSEPQA